MNCLAGPSKLSLPKYSFACRCASTASQHALPRLPSSPPSDKAFRKIQKKVLTAAAKGETWPAWQKTPDRGIGERVELRDSVRRIKQTRPARLSKDAAEFMEADSQLDGAFHQLDDAAIQALPIGSVVEVRRHHIVFHGCVLGFELLDGAAYVRSLNGLGDVVGHHPYDILFTIPAYFPKEIVSRAGQGDYAETPIEEEARVSIIKRLRELTRDVEQTLIRVGPRAALLYDSFRPKDPAAWGQLTTMDAARFIDLTTPEDIPHTRTVFAAHKYMFSDAACFVVDPSRHRASQTYELRPANDVAVLKTVSSMVQNRDPMVAEFAVKARQIINISRTLRKDSGTIQPLSASLPSFNSVDLSIISFLKLYVDRRRLLQEDPAASAIPPILKLIGLYDGEITRFTIFQLLKEIGIHTPWEDIVSNDRLLTTSYAESQRDDRYAESLIKSHKHGVVTSRNALSPGSEEFYPYDLHASMRYDFGNLPVFVIDDAKSQELDDGVSIEPVAGSEGEVWIHAHVADPTVLLHPGHVLAKEAMQRAQTAYLVEKTHRMLPSSLTSFGMSLTPDESGNGRNVLTFSGRIGKSGEVLEAIVRPGLIRNIHQITYAQANTCLGLEAAPSKFTPLFQLSRTETSNSVQPWEKAAFPKQDLSSLFSASQRMRDHRCQQEFFGFLSPEIQVRLYPDNLPTNPSGSTTPMLWHGFPRIEVEPRLDLTASQEMVAELMILGNRVGAQYCKERGIPILFRFSPPPLVPTSTTMAEALALRSRGSVYLSRSDYAKLGIVALPGGHSVTPAAHFALGMSADTGYSRMTSPLRRFSDLIGHWQIKSSMLDPSLSKLPFSLQQLEEVGFKLERRSQLIRRAEAATREFWALSLIQRILETALDLETRAAFEALPAEVLGPPKQNSTTRDFVRAVYLPSLGLEATLRGLRKRDDLAIQDMITVRVVDVRLDYASSLLVERV